jgi:hypothetical protein
MKIYQVLSQSAPHKVWRTVLVTENEGLARAEQHARRRGKLKVWENGEVVEYWEGGL